MKGNWTIPLSTLTGTHTAKAGSKAVVLGQMLRSGLPVPRGFVVTALAFCRYVESAPEWQAVLAELDQVGASVTPDVQGLSQRIRAALDKRPIPPKVEQAIASSLEGLPGTQFWAVRSSATVEDLPEASFAGQHDSFLNVPRGEVLEQVRQCWLSLFTPRAILYRAKKGVPQHGAAMAVIVQEMIPAESAGILFTADPITQDRRRIVIEGARGLGDQVVAGRVAPDRLVLAKASGAILERTSGRAADGGPGSAHPQCGESTAADKSVEQAVQDDALARRLVDLSRRVEQMLPGPLDIEWAVAGGEVYLLQARPITGKTSDRSWEDRQVWTNLNTGEVAPDVMTPITWSMIQLLLGSLCCAVFRLVGADMRRAPPIGRVAGRIYFNANTGLAALKPFSFLLRHTMDFAQALGGGELEDYRQAPVSIPPEDLPDLGFRWPKYILSWPRVLYDLIRHSPGRGDGWTTRLKHRSSELEAIELDSMSARDAARFFVQLLREAFQGWDLLYLATQGAVLPIFHKACRDWLDDPNLTLGYQLFSGLGDMPEAEAGLALWRLAVLAHGDPETEASLRSGSAWEPVSAQLNHSETGRRFLAGWAQFMREHGHHCRGELELFNARWSETPDYILGLVRGYLGAIGQSDPLEHQAQLARKRLALTEQCRQRLKNPVKRWLFSRALRRAQRLAVNREEWKNQAVRHMVVMRRVLLVLGRLLCQQGALTQPDDVFFLEVAEIEPVANGTAGFDAKDLVRARRQEYEANLLLKPPPVVFGQYKPGIPAAPHQDANLTELAGIPVSPGIVRGRAKVILRNDDHLQVLPGEILIAPFTDPAWTPYFVTAAGVVMDQGGILSHGSIVAREYGLPAVTNVGSATRVICTGDLVEVDGNRGRVAILERLVKR